MESPTVVNFGVIKLEVPRCFLCAYQSQSQICSCLNFFCFLVFVNIF